MSYNDYQETGTLTVVRRKSGDNKKLIPLMKIELNQLIFFKDHPFKLYEGEQLNILIQSIKEHGIREPIHVRHIDEGKYEILSGHNRVNASKEAGLDTIPALIHEDMSDEDARIFVVKSNFEQRRLNNMKYSEYANAIFMLNEAMKKKSGFRSDKIKSEENPDTDNSLRTMEVIGKMFGISRAKVGRYIRIAYLIKELQEELDNDKIKKGPAEHLSYLKESEQMIVKALLKTNVKINIEQAKALRTASEASNEKSLDEATIKEILEPKESDAKVPSIRLPKKIISQFFDEGQSEEEVLNTIIKALEQYRLSQNL